MATANPANLFATLESYLVPSHPINASTSSDPAQPALHLLPPMTLTKLRNLGSVRVKDMRALGQSRQIISHIPFAAPPPICAYYNDAMQSAITMNNEKFAAIALLPTEGKEAARELQRCVGKYRFVGGMLGLSRDVKLDDGTFEELWKLAEQYRVPVVLRQMWPVGSEIEEYQNNLAATFQAPFLTHLHTSHTASPLPLLHLYLSSVFDRHPNLRLVLAHPAALPSLLPRIEHLLSSIPASDKPKRSFVDVWQHNIYLTTADVQDMSSLRALLEQIPIDRILYASNYPLEERGKELMEELRESGFLTKEEWERVAWGNAEGLFGKKGGAVKVGK
ncbi:hypothetical protein EJ02DRAFT_501365 [Clathrospora elynae]|uniref:Amidohydrolase-related domain-containing protein n=1 Tax=Clathrospora elynae TaxID=706981 RepID=A0A6A5SX33_9PLEO|nr:hypothetical protein EJ02DRAFT_501365 [Clathrospora elynae]